MPTPQLDKEAMKLLTVWLDTKLYKQFQKACIDNGVSMSDVIRDLIREYLK